MEEKTIALSKNKKHQKNKYVSIGLGIFLIVIFVFFTWMSIQYTYQIQITQLSNQSHSQMMGYVIKTYHNKVIVIDGGTHEDTQNLIDTIEHLTGKVDAWFITHPHKDHASSIIDVIENTDIQIDQIYVSLNDTNWYEQNEPNRAQEAEDLRKALQHKRIKEKVTEPKVNDIITIDNITCEILGIKNPEITTNAINNSSMIIKISTNKKNVLFLGDTGVESATKLINTEPQDKLKADVVQMSHHGQSGAPEELYQIIRPEICLWPTPDWLWTNDSGEGEDSGPWKTKETRSWMEKLKVKQHVIEKNGNQTITI